MTDTVEQEVDTPDSDSPKVAWRALLGAAIGGIAIVIAGGLGVGAIKSEGSSNVRAGGPGGGQFPGRQFGPQGQMPGQGGMQGPPPPFTPRRH